MVKVDLKGQVWATQGNSWIFCVTTSTITDLLEGSSGPSTILHDLFLKIKIKEQNKNKNKNNIKQINSKIQTP